MVRIARLICVLTAFCVVHPGMALAADAENRADLAGFKGTRTISMGGASSRCIGRSHSPLCAAETFLACLLRSDEGLCRTVGVAPFGVKKVVKERYRFGSMRLLTRADADASGGADWARPGNVDVVLQTSSCFADGRCAPYRRYALVLAPAAGGGWVAVSWSSEDDSEDFAE